jgi:hypothetical protein
MNKVTKYNKSCGMLERAADTGEVVGSVSVSVEVSACVGERARYQYTLPVAGWLY